MFVMTSDIKIGTMTVRASAVKYKASVSNYTDTCVLILPLAPYVKSAIRGTDLTPGAGMSQQSTCVFGHGDKVSVRLGYNGATNRVFEGFVYRVNYKDQLVIECEGYAFQLRDKEITKSYQKTTAREILADITAGTDIRLSDAIDDIPLSNVTFRNTPKLKVLEWLQRECACQVWFDERYLYAGASRYVHPNPSYQEWIVKARIGWNTISADELKKTEKETVQINLVSKNPQGEVKKTRSEGRRYSATKEIRVRQGLGEAYLAKAVEELQQREDYRGYEGEITLFGQPWVRKSDKVEIVDERFPERSGSYFAEEVSGSYDRQGYRQRVKLRYYAGK